MGTLSAAKIKRIAIVASCCALALILAMYVLRRNEPILFTINPDPAALRARSYCIVNPFRDRGPELAAEACLESLRHGETGVLKPLLPEVNVDHFLSRESEYRIQSWRIGGRWDSLNSARLMYWVRRGGGYPEIEEEVHIGVAMKGGKWIVSNYSAIY